MYLKIIFKNSDQNVRSWTQCSIKKSRTNLRHRRVMELFPFAISFTSSSRLSYNMGRKKKDCNFFIHIVYKYPASFGLGRDCCHAISPASMRSWRHNRTLNFFNSLRRCLLKRLMRCHKILRFQRMRSV